MSNTTVAEFANELKKPTDTLLEQLNSAGVATSAPSDALSDADKQKLLSYLQASHGTNTAERKKITLVKKSTSEIKQADSTGRARTIQVEVRKKRTFIKRDDGAEMTAPEVEEAPAEAPAAPAIDHAELARREEEARRQAELIRLQEQELVEKRRLREEQEARDREAHALAEAAVQVEKSTITTQAGAQEQDDLAKKGHNRTPHLSLPAGKKRGPRKPRHKRQPMPHAPKICKSAAAKRRPRPLPFAA